MRIIALIACCASLFGQVSLRDSRSGDVFNSLSVTELSRDSAGIRVLIDGVVDGMSVRKVVLVTSPVTRVAINGRIIELFYQRPLPSVFAGSSTLVKPTMQFTQEMVGAMMDRIAIRRYQEQKEADRLGFESVNKMKQFAGQNRTKIAQAAKNGSLDPVADVKATADAKRAYRASAEQQDASVRSGFDEIRMQMQGSFQKAQAPIYSKERKASDAEANDYATVCQGIEELRLRLVRENRRVLRTGDLTVDLKNQDIFTRNIDYLRAAKIKTEPPFSRPDINQAQKVVDLLKETISLPLSN